MDFMFLSNYHYFVCFHTNFLNDQNISDDNLREWQDWSQAPVRQPFLII